MPRATKKSTTKKSRMLTALATTSTLYGKLARLTPAISAPISRESPMALAAPAMKKHQPSAVTSTSSGALAMDRNRYGSRYLAMAKPATTRITPRRSEPRSGARFGFRMFGWTASMPTAHRSWMTRTPSVIRPGMVSSSNLSLRILTTTSVLDRLMQAARYRSAELPSWLRTPMTAKNASPSAMQIGTCSAPVSSTAMPPDAILRRSISSPMTKSKRMRPISATISMLSRSLTSLRPMFGPMITPVAR